MRSGCLHDRPHTRRVCARREQDSAGACPPAGTGTWVCHFVFASASSCVITAAYFWRMSNR
ncbi:hypothetical protein L491_1839, partial [Bordetella bronchiseptica 3E44]